MSEITYEYVREYLQAIIGEESAILTQIRKEAVKNEIPIIKSEVKQLLEVILTMNKPGKILEIGTAVGYSAILMSEYLKDNGSILTLERSQDMIVKAKENISYAKKESAITIMEGDAEKILPKLEGEYDFILMDAAKGQYITFLPYCLKLLRIGGIMLSDNVLQDGYIAKSKWSIPRRQRTIHQRMRQYIWELNHNPDLKTAVLPIADGVTLSYKIK